MAFTAQDVKTLREITGCGMMDCKKALTETNGDQEKAIELLREKGLAAAAKKAGRIAAEGIVKAYVDTAKKVGVVIEVNAETDFVAKNADFQAFVDTCAQTVVEQNPADVDALLACKACGSEMTIADLTTEKIQTIGENIKIRRFTRYEGDVATYIHAGGSIGVMVKFDTDVADKEGLRRVRQGRCNAGCCCKPWLPQRDRKFLLRFWKKKKKSSRFRLSTKANRKQLLKRWYRAELRNSTKKTA